MATSQFTTEQVARFWSRVAVCQHGRTCTLCCWEWQGRKDRYNYGKGEFHGKERRTHRVAWEIAFGEIAEGLLVCHACDNRPCANVAHLFLGRPIDNINDALRKGRMKSNTLIMGAKLTEAKVLHIRLLAAQHIPHETIAAMFDVTRPTIWQIVRRKIWRHVP